MPDFQVLQPYTLFSDFPELNYVWFLLWKYQGFILVMLCTPGTFKWNCRRCAVASKPKLSIFPKNVQFSYLDFGGMNNWSFLPKTFLPFYHLTCIFQNLGICHFNVLQNHSLYHYPPFLLVHPSGIKQFILSNKLEFYSGSNSKSDR